MQPRFDKDVTLLSAVIPEPCTGQPVGVSPQPWVSLATGACRNLTAGGEGRTALALAMPLQPCGMGGETKLTVVTGSRTRESTHDDGV